MSIFLIYPFVHFAHFVIKVFTHFFKWVKMFAHLFILLIYSCAHIAHLEKIVLGVPWVWYTQGRLRACASWPSAQGSIHQRDPKRRQKEKGRSNNYILNAWSSGKNLLCCRPLGRVFELLCRAFLVEFNLYFFPASKSLHYSVGKTSFSFIFY